jgi:hypothetical protein
MASLMYLAFSRSHAPTAPGSPLRETSILT